MFHFQVTKQHANYEGDLTVLVDESGNRISWSFDGSVTFFDRWDFDPRPWGERQSRYAETLTRFGDVILPGEGFDVYTPSTPLSQSNLQTNALWVGAGVAGQPSNLASEIQE